MIGLMVRCTVFTAPETGPSAALEAEQMDDRVTGWVYLGSSGGVSPRRWLWPPREE